MLLNSAGQIDPEYRPPAEGGAFYEAKSTPPPRLLVEVRLCQWYMPVNLSDSNQHRS